MFPFHATPFSVPCTSVEVYGDLLLGGYSCGHIRVYSISTPTLLVDIAAHGQCVTALDVHRPSGTVSHTLYICTHICTHCPATHMHLRIIAYRPCTIIASHLLLTLERELVCSVCLHYAASFRVRRQYPCCMALAAGTGPTDAGESVYVRTSSEVGMEL